MRILIVEDDFISRRVLKDMLSDYGDCDVVVDGEEAIQEFTMALDEKRPYRVIFLDIMMPNVDGLQALKQIREIERQRNIAPAHEVKVIMTTALGDPKTVIDAYYQGGADSYLVKPLTRAKIDAELQKVGRR